MLKLSIISRFRYGSDLASVESYRQNNFTADLASEFLSAEAARDGYWLGLRAYNQLQTNTLEADAGHQVSQSCTLLTLPLVPLLIGYYTEFILLHQI